MTLTDHHAPFPTSDPTPRKRPRLDSVDTSRASASASMGASTHSFIDSPLRSSIVVRDETYYFADGSCVLRVGNTLFNVHKSVLSRDNSSFGTMFSLPPGGSDVEGMSDSNPIVLLGDTESEFRNFLWSLYALPHELMVVTTESADLTQLIDIANKANKYSFTSIQNWALDALQQHVQRKPSPILGALPCGTSTPGGQPSPEAVASCGTLLTRLVRLAQTCGHEALLSTMVARLRAFMGLSLRFAYLAITLADELDLRPLRGCAYLEVMQKATVVVGKPRPDDPEESWTAPGEVDEEGRLVVTPSQQLRLLSGYFQLTNAWERLRVKPPAFEHATSCGATWHQHGCTQSWNEFWKEKTKSDGVLTLGLADVLGRLRTISKEFDRWGSATYMHHDCRQAARKTISDKMKAIEDALPDYFSDCPLIE